MENKQTTREIQMPIDRMHYSMLTQLLRNPLIFKLKYILGVYDGKMGMSGMIGSAGHLALRFYYGGDTDRPVVADHNEAVAEAIETGMNYLQEYQDTYIDYGKTGSREKMLKMYSQAMNFYFAEEPEYNEILICEEKMESEIETVDGDKLPLPAVTIPDLVHKRKDGGIEIIDHKFVRSFINPDSEDYIKIVQAQFIWHVLKGAKGIVADRIIFRQVKTTINSGANEGKPQIQDYVVPFAHEQYRVIFYNLYRDAVEFIKNPNAIYLPNIADPIDGEQAGLLYAQGLITGDMSDVEVMHKVKDIAFKSKKFVTSRLNKVENKHLEPSEKIKLRLAEFGIPIEPVKTIYGPSITQYQFDVSSGIRMSIFKKHKADIERAIEAKGEVRILAPIPGTSMVGIEVGNEKRTAAILKKQYLNAGTLSLPIGINVQGDVVSVELDDMPHLLIAGSTGSGKSVLLHTMITALTKQMKPEQMQLILIDPKRVDLVEFKNKKHLHGGKIVYEYDEALVTLKVLVDEMEIRYKKLERTKTRNIKEYNEKAKEQMRYIVIVIDEFGDLMLRAKMNERTKKDALSLKKVANRESVLQKARMFARQGLTYEVDIDLEDTATVEEMIVRIAQMARAVGIHLILATQRPSVDVITGLIKANIPARIALTTTSAIDSKVILGEDGAEKLTGKGDLLFMHPGGGKQRLQGLIIK